MRLIGFYIFAATVALLPILFPDNYFVTVVGISAGLHAILAVGLNLLMGYAGQISLGHAAFFGMGAYASGILTTRYAWPVPLAMFTGLAVAGLIAWLLARPILRLRGHYLILRLRGHYLAMATLGFGMIIHVIMVQATRWTGGPDGLTGIPHLNLFGWSVDNDLRWYGVIAVLRSGYRSTSSTRESAAPYALSMVPNLPRRCSASTPAVPKPRSL